MTLPVERTYAVLNTRRFLLALCNPKETPKVPQEIRKQARHCLKHFPSGLDLDMHFEGREIFGEVEERCKLITW
jgi:hypothetical protein